MEIHRCSIFRDPQPSHRQFCGNHPAITVAVITRHGSSVFPQNLHREDSIIGMILWDRVAAAIVACSAWTGLALQLVDSLQLTGNRPLAALWDMLMYFTILTNLVVATAFTAVAAGFAVAPWVFGGAMLAIVLVGVIYALLLSHLPIGECRTSALANSLVHRITPALVTLYWVAFAPKGTLQWIDAVYWTAYPVCYLAYVLLRGQFTQRYPYHFIDVPQIGWKVTLRNAAAIAFGFVLASLLVVATDHWSLHFAT
jgi:hypothetical protein